MQIIAEDELIEIISSYGVSNLVYQKFLQVGPDMILYLFKDNKNVNHILIAADFLGGYEEIKLPYQFEFDDPDYSQVSFEVVNIFSYINNASKKALGYIDDKNFWTKASTGDVCMLLKCSNINCK